MKNISIKGPINDLSTNKCNRFTPDRFYKKNGNVSMKVQKYGKYY